MNGARGRSERAAREPADRSIGPSREESRVRSRKHFALGSALFSAVLWAVTMRSSWTFILTLGLCLSDALYSDMTRESKLTRAASSLLKGAVVAGATWLLRRRGLMR